MFAGASDREMRVRVDTIEIHAGAVDFQFEPIRRLEAKCEAKTIASKAPTIEDVNFKLQEMAAGIGADAVVDVKYDSGMSMTSWRSMKAAGLAVKRISDDVPCPVCAETIKRAAKKCRFCGAEFDAQAAPATGTAPAATPATEQPWVSKPAVNAAQPRRAIPSEPLKSSDNSMAPFVIIGVVLAVLGLLAALASS